jgi:DNA polymerase-3 subunit delta
MDFLTYFKQISSGSLSHLAVFTGPEVYNIEHTIKYIEDNFLNADYKDFNFTSIDVCTDVDSVISAASTLPFFDSRRILIFNKTGLLKQIKEDQEVKLMNFLKDLPEHLVLIFNEQDTDMRKKLGKWLKKESDWVVFEKLDHSDFIKWTNKKFNGYGKKIDKHILNYFADRIDYLDAASEKNLFDVDNTIRSISGTVGDITEEIVNMYVTVPIEHNIFKMMDAISMNDMSNAIQILNQFISNGEPEIKIFSMISQQFRNIFKIKLLLASGYTSTTAATKLEIHPFVAKKASAFATKYTLVQLNRIMVVLEDTDLLLKSTGLKSQWMIEKALFEIAHLK